MMLVAAGLFFLALPQMAYALDAPTLALPKNNQTIPPDTAFVVSGNVVNGTIVYVFVDGKLLGGVKTSNGKNGIGSFVYRTKKTFAFGNHMVHVQAVKGAEKSLYTERRKFIIPKTWPRRVDGVIVPAQKANLVPYAVMIENLSLVRPQSGLSAASVVYETLAEGGIPRFLAIFARDDLSRIGPVRSARPYFVDWAKEYQGPLLHAGGSRDALEEIGRQHVRSIDGLLNRTAKYFYRAGKVASTHNLYVRGDRLSLLKSTYGFTDAKATFPAWSFKNDVLLAKRPKEKRTLTIDFKSGRAYIVAYTYDRAGNRYLRSNGGTRQFDALFRPKTFLAAKNVIVQLTKKERVLDAKKRIALEITGQGKGWLLQDGKLQQILWKKPKASSRTKYYFLNGKEVSFNRGATWVEVVPENRPVLYQ